MKLKLIAAMLCFAPACAVRAQNFDVRLFTQHAPATVTVTAANNAIAWRTCPACTDKSGPSLSIGQYPNTALP